MNAIPHPLPVFLANPDKKHFIDGAARPSLSGERLEPVNSSTGRALAILASGREADVDAAVKAAWGAFE